MRKSSGDAEAGGKQWKSVEDKRKVWKTCGSWWKTRKGSEGVRKARKRSGRPWERAEEAGGLGKVTVRYSGEQMPPSHVSMRERVWKVKNTPLTSKHEPKGWWWVNKCPISRFNAREGLGRLKTPPCIETQAEGVVVVNKHPISRFDARGGLTRSKTLPSHQNASRRGGAGSAWVPEAEGI